MHFFSSSRAVLWIMKAEYSKIDGWKKWHDEKEIDTRTKEMLKNCRRKKSIIEKRSIKNGRLYCDRINRR